MQRVRNRWFDETLVVAGVERFEKGPVVGLKMCRQDHQGAGVAVGETSNVVEDRPEVL
ncbi:MAG: hypothetical protein IIB04_05765 [Acidobacteria bacterium]|nr:hypothetical protein [Acidobacteriota bacterium]